ncbi:MAG: haloacid dehalogenase-like hydrolase, partial [Sphingobium sp.]
FTPFLIFAARRRAPWRLVALPLWVLAMASHKAGMVARKPLKQFGFRLFLGRTISTDTAQELADAYAAHTLAQNILPGAIPRVEADRAAGRMLVMATAAPDFYARAIGTALGFDAVIATRHDRTGGGVSHRIVGENCYGPQKLARIRAWLTDNALTADSTRFYSDDLSDAPTLDWAGESYVVNADAKLAQIAQDRGWTTLSLR